MSDFVAFDLETTGLSPRTDRVIEIGAVRFGADGAPTATFDMLVDPGRPIPLAIERLTGIRQADADGAPTPAEAVAQFADFCEGAQLVAHGAGFDIGFCAGLVPAAFARRPVMDTLELARILLPRAASHSLPLLSRELAITHLRPHRADSDAAATAELFLRLIRRAESLPTATLTTMRELVEWVDAPLGRFFRTLVKGEGNVVSVPGMTIAAATDLPRISVPHRPATPVPMLANGSLESATAHLLGANGPLAAEPGYEFREGQLQMARAVAQTLERNGRLLVEAGTGVGKSLAYLVPLLLDAAGGHRRAVVATHTVTLQEQLVEHDIPALVARLPVAPSVAMLKGRQHYISLRRWHRFLTADYAGTADSDLDRLRFTLKLLVWLAETSSGDRAELRLTGSEEPLWRLVESEADDCLGAACRHWGDASCPMVAARVAAVAADVVVTNHALLLADAERQGQVLAPFATLVIDEAHRFEEAATQQLGRRLRAADVQTILARLPSPEPGSTVATAAHRASDAMSRLFGEVKGFLAETFGSDQPGNGTVALSEAVRERASFATVLRAATSAVTALRRCAVDLLDARGLPYAEVSRLPEPERVGEELGLAAAALEEAAGAIERVLLQPSDGHVAWLELRAEQTELHEAPVRVDEQLRATVFDRTVASVLTSATLSVGGSFDFVRTRVGIGAAEELIVDSPFDFLSQAVAVLPTDIPAFDAPGYDAALAELCVTTAARLHGRTLVLFTGYAPLRRVHALARARLEARGIVVLGQGIDGTRRQLLGSFLANPRTVLLGTSTFWEGIDLAGDALRCVVIAKLPFPVPTDPLVQARSADLRDPFRDLHLPTAVIRLRQGFGRLIRRIDDRGAVVLCDARITDREYGQAFLAALPPAAVVGVPVERVAGVVEGFVRNGSLPAPETHIPAPSVATGWQAEEPA